MGVARSNFLVPIYPKRLFTQSVCVSAYVNPEQSIIHRCSRPDASEQLCLLAGMSWRCLYVYIYLHRVWGCITVLDHMSAWPMHAWWEPTWLLAAYSFSAIMDHPCSKRMIHVYAMLWWQAYVTVLIWCTYVQNKTSPLLYLHGRWVMMQLAMLRAVWNSPYYTVMPK